MHVWYQYTRYMVMLEMVVVRDPGLAEVGGLHIRGDLAMEQLRDGGGGAWTHRPERLLPF